MNLKDFLPKNIGEMSRVVSNPYAHSFAPFKEEDLDEELKEGFGGELKGAAKRKFETERKKNAEVLGYKMVPEASVTGNLDGGEGPPKTPYAFQSTKKKRKKDKEKEKKISTNSTGYTIAEDIYVALVSKTGRQFTGKQPRFNPRNLGHPGLLVTTADKIFKSEVGRNLSQKLASKLKITKRYNQKGLQGSKKTADRGTRQYIDAIGGVIKSKMVPEIPNGRTMPVTKRLDLVFANSQSQLDNVLKGKYKVVKESVNEAQKRQATDIRRRYDNAYLKFQKEVNNVIKMVDKYQGDKTDGKIIAKQFKKSLTPLDDLMQSWTAGQYRNPNISESINESEEKKIEKLLLKYGNNKKDTKGIMKWYGRVSKMYKKANPAKKAQIMNSLWAQNEGTCGYGEDGKLGDKPAGPHLLKKKVQEISNSEAKTLLQQLGGRRFMMMVGAKNLGRDNKGLHMKIGRNSKSISHVVINYNRGKDLYDMKFLRVRKGKVKVVNKVLGVYADQLNNTFEKNTGLYTRM